MLPLSRRIAVSANVIFFPCTRLEIKFILSYLILSYPYIERYDFYTTLKFQELLDLRAHTRFLTPLWRRFPQYWLLWGNPYKVTVGFPSKGPVMRYFDVYFGDSLNKQPNKRSSCRWFEIPWSSCDCNVITRNIPGILAEHALPPHARGPSIVGRGGQYAIKRFRWYHEVSNLRRD